MTNTNKTRKTNRKVFAVISSALVAAAIVTGTAVVSASASPIENAPQSFVTTLSDKQLKAAVENGTKKTEEVKQSTEEKKTEQAPKTNETGKHEGESGCNYVDENGKHPGESGFGYIEDNGWRPCSTGGFNFEAVKKNAEAQADEEKTNELGKHPGESGCNYVNENGKHPGECGYGYTE